METKPTAPPGFLGRFRPTSLRFRLMLLILFSALPAFALLFYMSVRERNGKIRAAKADATRTAELVVGSAAQLAEGTRTLLASLSHAADDIPLDPKNVSARFAIIQRHTRQYLNIGYASAEGRIIASAIPLPADAMVSATDRAWFQRLEGPRELAVGEMQVGRITQKPCIIFAFSLPHQASDRPQAAVYAALKQESLQACIAKAALPDTCILVIIDRTGLILARNPEPGRWVGQKSTAWNVFQKQRQIEDGFVRAVGIDGMARLYRFLPVPNSDDGLFVGIGVSEAAIVADSNARFLRSLVILSLCMGGAMFLASQFGRLAVLRHVEMVASASRLLAKGDFSARVRMKGGAREFRQLARTFDGMAEALQHHNEHLEEMVQERTRKLQEEIAERRKTAEALRKSEISTRTLMDAIPEAALLLDAEGRVIAANQTAAGRLGRAAAELPGVLLVSLCPPEQALQRNEHFRHAVESGKAVQFEDAVNGRIFACHVTPIRNADGAVDGLAVLEIDITKGRLDKAEQKKLLNELQRTNGELRNALANVKKLSGLLPICAWCKKVRNDQGYWNQVEAYLAVHSELQFTHCICPECQKSYFPTPPPAP